MFNDNQWQKSGEMCLLAGMLLVLTTACIPKKQEDVAIADAAIEGDRLSSIEKRGRLICEKTDNCINN